MKESNMDEFVPSTPHAEWNAIATKRRELMAGAADEKHPDAEKRLAEVENQLLEGRAPDLEGVILKLTVLWESIADQHSQAAGQYLGVIGDLRRIQFETC
jgi:hypothetical protein